MRDKTQKTNQSNQTLLQSKSENKHTNEGVKGKIYEKKGVNELEGQKKMNLGLYDSAQA